MKKLRSKYLSENLLPDNSYTKNRSKTKNSSNRLLIDPHHQPHNLQQIDNLIIEQLMQYKKSIKIYRKAEEIKHKLRFHRRSVELSLWDTAGNNPMYENLRIYSYNHTNVVLLCFSFDSLESFKSLDAWITEIRLHTENIIKNRQYPSPKILIIGLKSDLKHQFMDKRITQSMIDTLLVKYKIKKQTSYFEVSSLNNDNVEQVLNAACLEGFKHSMRLRKQIRKNYLSLNLFKCYR